MGPASRDLFLPMEIVPKMSWRAVQMTHHNKLGWSVTLWSQRSASSHGSTGGPRGEGKPGAPGVEEEGQGGSSLPAAQEAQHLLKVTQHQTGLPHLLLLPGSPTWAAASHRGRTYFSWV